jgi:hypothetical protein
MFANSHARIGSRFFAIVLLGLLPQIAFAEDTEAGGHQGNATSNAAAAPNGSRASSSEDAVSESAAKNTDDIDTRISVQPRHTGNKPGKAGEAKVKFNLSGVKNPHRRVFSASRANKQAVRNAVSVPITPHEVFDRQGSEHAFIAPTQHLPAATIGAIGNTTIGIAKTESGLVHQMIVPPSASPTVLNRNLNGTSAGHRGITSAGIGGPARTATTGLNGTTIRPPH